MKKLFWIILALLVGWYLFAVLWAASFRKGGLLSSQTWTDPLKSIGYPLISETLAPSAPANPATPKTTRTATPAVNSTQKNIGKVWTWSGWVDADKVFPGAIF